MSKFGRRNTCKKVDPRIKAKTRKKLFLVRKK